MLYRSLGEESCSQTVGDDETNAQWGGTDKHVLLWSLTGDDPYIAIYETEELADSWAGSQEISRLSLNPGLLEVEARMLEGPLADGRMEVFIFEVEKSGRKRILLWDANANTVTAEINMSLVKTRVTTSSEPQPPHHDIT